MSFITFNNLLRFEQGIKDVLIQKFGDIASIIGSTTLNTTSQDLKGAINEHEVDIGDMALSTVATDLTGAINETHDVPLDIQELYKPLIAPLSVSLIGFREDSYLYYGKPWDSERRIFVRVSKTTAMSGTTAIGNIPAGYRPNTDQTLTAYDDDGNVLSDVTVTITDVVYTGAVSVVGSVAPNTYVMASYSPSNPQSGVITKNDIEKLIVENSKDSGWQSATFTTNVVATSGYDKYRLKNKILYVNMVLTINEVVGGGKPLFTLPAWYRPNRVHHFPCSFADSTTTRTIQVTTDGVVKLYANGTPTSSGMLIYLDFCFPID